MRRPYAKSNLVPAGSVSSVLTPSAFLFVSQGAVESRKSESICSKHLGPSSLTGRLEPCIQFLAQLAKTRAPSGKV